MNVPHRLLWESRCGDPIVYRVAVAGDFLPAGDITLPAGGWAEAANPLRAQFQDANLSFVNLESVLDAELLSPRPLSGLGQNLSAPAASIGYLEAMGVRVASLANNHSYDFGAVGVTRTREALAQRGVVPLGAGRSLQAAPEIFLWQKPGNIRIGFWAAAIASSDLATRTTIGVEPATVARASRAAEALASCGARFSIALLHAGCMRTNRPDPGDAARMDAIARCGFRIVAAAHSHRISGAKLLDNKCAGPSLCFYGLGSIVSGLIATPVEREGLVIVAGIHSSGDLARVEVRPVFLGKSGFGEAPSPEMAGVILERFRRLSEEISAGSSKHLFYRDVSPGLLGLHLRDARAAYAQSGIGGLLRKAARLRVRHFHRLFHRVMG